MLKFPTAFLAFMTLLSGSDCLKNSWTPDSFILASLDAKCCGLGPYRHQISQLCDPDSFIASDEELIRIKSALTSFESVAQCKYDCYINTKCEHRDHPYRLRISILSNLSDAASGSSQIQVANEIVAKLNRFTSNCEDTLHVIYIVDTQTLFINAGSITAKRISAEEIQSVADKNIFLFKSGAYANGIVNLASEFKDILKVSRSPPIWLIVLTVFCTLLAGGLLVFGCKMSVSPEDLEVYEHSHNTQSATNSVYHSAEVIPLKNGQ